MYACRRCRRTRAPPPCGCSSFSVGRISVEPVEDVRPPRPVATRPSTPPPTGRRLAPAARDAARSRGDRERVARDPEPQRASGVNAASRAGFAAGLARALRAPSPAAASTACLRRPRGDAATAARSRVDAVVVDRARAVLEPRAAGRGSSAGDVRSGAVNASATSRCQPSGWLYADLCRPWASSRSRTRDDATITRARHDVAPGPARRPPRRRAARLRGGSVPVSAARGAARARDRRIRTGSR